MPLNASPNSLLSDTTPETQRRGHYIRLRTIIWLRWAAVIGQVTALCVGKLWFGLALEEGLFFLVVGASVLANCVLLFVFPANRRLSEPENAFMVLFDLLQIGALLFLAGGLNNPFSILIVGPVAVSAAVLSRLSTLILGLTTLLIATGLTRYYFPLETVEGFVLRIPDLFIFGTWVAIVIAVVFLGLYVRRMAEDANAVSAAYQAAQLALSREQKLNDLAGVVAAAAHEMGTPLATIKLTSSELLSELEDGSDAQEDVALIAEQADRCRDILRSMGRAGKSDQHLRRAPVSEVVEYAASPHLDRGKTVSISVESDDETPQPEILRQPEIIHGLRNLIQNAVDFARSEVRVQTRWNSEALVIRIQDDGHGFPPGMIERIGDPFMRRRANADRNPRGEYEGMGLGLFIAKTLLERSGAELSFANAPAGRGWGALAVVKWPLENVRVDLSDGRPSLGQNEPIESSNS